MVANSRRPDYYAVLQVQPGAEREVIEAAYRQLMKKYHPDVAGDDPARIAAHQQRAIAINEAYGVLRDPVRRRMYDDAQGSYGEPAVQPRASPPEPREAPYAGRPVAHSRPVAPPPPPASEPAWNQPIEPESRLEGTLRGPLEALAAAYYLLPGPYEWEKDRQRELLTACLLPPLGAAAFLLATGRLQPLIGQSLNATVLAWCLLLLVSMPAWRSLPRAVLTGAPSVLLVSGLLDPVLHRANLPIWLAWVLLGTISMVVSARLYVFGVLPMVGLCWLIGRLG